jgi:methylmalonyl-CoA/ethylmalonyl-CoA epimerase
VNAGTAEDARFWVKMRLPMPEPSFGETVQIGIVVRDLETTMRKYVDEYGIGPWETHEVAAGNAEDLHEHGRPVERSWRLATTMVGQVQWELIEPRDDAVAPTNYDRALAEEAKKGREAVLSGTFSGYRVAYLPTERDLGVIVEIFSDDRAREQTPDAG